MSLIINSPFLCPAQHWSEDTAGRLAITPGRRPASTEIFDPRNNPDEQSHWNGSTGFATVSTNGGKQATPV